MRIAIFDYDVERTNPVGGCHRQLLEGICDEHEVTVFAVRCDNPAPDRIEWVRVPAARRPLALLFLTYHLVAPLCFAVHRLRRGKRFDLVQHVESNLSFGHLAYTHFCHRAYLRTLGSSRAHAGLRSFLRRLDHRLHALAEPFVYRRARTVVVPSHGLARELASEYPVVEGRVIVIPNSVDVERMRPPGPAERRAARRRLGFSDDNVVFVFVALGHFERKGLPLLLEALSEVDDQRVRLLVVGGREDLVNFYRRKVDRLGLGGRVRFAGLQNDVRPFLHASDVFVLPSEYETFSLVALEAAAAGLPLLVTPLHGVQDYVRPGRNGIVVEHESGAVAQAISTFVAMSPTERSRLGQQAMQDAQRYNPDAFVNAWRLVYGGIGSSPAPGA